MTVSGGQQQHLFNGPPGSPLRALTGRQMKIYQHICNSPDGLIAVELGQLIHSDKRKHHANELCEYCGRDDARALKEKAIRTRLRRRSDGIYEPLSHDDWTGRQEPERPPSAQLVGELPGETWEDAFGGSA